MKLNLKAWHKVSADKTHTTMRNQQGHELRVCHTALSKAHRDALEKLPVKMAQGGMVQSMAHGGEVKAYADGGDVEQNASQMPEIPTPQEQVQYIQDQAARNQVPPEQQRLQELYNIDVAAKHMGDPGDPGAMDMMIGGGQDPKRLDPVSLKKAQLDMEASKLAEAEKQQRGIQDTMEQNALRAQVGLPPLPVPPELSPSAVSPNVSPVSQDIFKDLEAASMASEPQMGSNVPKEGVERVKQGLQQQSDAVVKQAARDQEILARQEQQMAAAETEFKKQWGDLEAQRKEIQTQLQNDSINPNRFWDNQNVGQKIGTAIGMILGGMGAGMLHQENPAISMINKAIDADINAQKANLGKKENLLQANLRQFGNIKDAMSVTRLMQQDAVLNKLKQSLATAQGPQAQALLAQEIGKLEMQQGASAQRMALERTISERATQDPSSVPTLIQQVRTFDPKRAHELEQQFVPGMGIAQTMDDAKKLKEMKAATDSTVNGIRQLKALISRPGKSFSPSAIAEAQVITGQLKGPMRAALGLGILSEGDMKLLDSMIANPTDMLSLDSSNRVRLNVLAKRMQDALTMSAKARGISNYDPVKSLPPNEQQMAIWARQNPQDPRSAMVLDKLGL